MFLVNWFEANTLMFLTVLALFAIPVVVAVIAFSKKTPKGTLYDDEGNEIPADTQEPVEEEQEA